MNDDDLITLVRRQRDQLPMDVPVELITRRGRAVRARRRVPALAAGALASAAAATLAVTTLTAGPAAAPHAQLAAWTVSKHADGDVYVTVRELRDPAGLQRTLRADGVPATVGESSPALSCQVNHVSKSELRAVGQFHPHGRTDVLVIHPPAIPRGTGLFIFDLAGSRVPHTNRQLPGPMSVGLVKDTPACTGS
jgi:hypothetical protein